MGRSLIVLFGLVIGLLGVACALDASPITRDSKSGEVAVTNAGEIIGRKLSDGVSYWKDLSTGLCFAVYMDSGDRGDVGDMAHVPCEAVEGKTLLFRSR